MPERAHGAGENSRHSAPEPTGYPPGKKVLQASAEKHSGLFRALRGGSGNSGVVTQFEFRLHPVRPPLLSGLVVYPYAQTRAVLEHYREFPAEALDDLSVWTVLRKAPPLPLLPETVHGTEVVVLALLYAGGPARSEKLIAPLRQFGTPVGEHVAVQPYAAWQQAFDSLLTPGARNYWKIHNFTKLTGGLLDVVIEYVGKLPTSRTEIFLGPSAAPPSAPRRTRPPMRIATPSSS